MFLDFHSDPFKHPENPSESYQSSLDLTPSRKSLKLRISKTPRNQVTDSKPYSHPSTSQVKDPTPYSHPTSQLKPYPNSNQINVLTSFDNPKSRY